MAISSSNVVQGKENPLISSLKYANDAIKQSFTLMQNAKQLGLQEKEMNYTKNLNLLKSVQERYTARSAQVGPMAAWDESRDMFAALYSALGVDDAVIAAHAKAMSESPFSQDDYQNLILNGYVTGKGNSTTTPDDINKAAEAATETTTTGAAGKGAVTAQYETKFTSEAIAARDKLMSKFGSDFLRAQKDKMLPKHWKEYETNGSISRDWVTAAAGNRISLMQTWNNDINKAITLGEMTKEEGNALWRDLTNKFYPGQGVVGPLLTAVAQLDELGGEAILGVEAVADLRNTKIDKVLPGRAGWVMGDMLPEGSTATVTGHPLTGQEAVSRENQKRAEDNRTMMSTGGVTGVQGVNIAGTDTAKSLTQQGVNKRMQTAEAAEAERARPGKSDNVYVLNKEKLTGMGPKPGEDIGSFIEKRTQHWKGQTTPGGYVIDDKLAKELATQESLIKPAYSKQTVVTNKPINPESEPPSNWVAGGKNAVVPEGVPPDAVSNKTSWNVGRNLYDWWAKRMAGVEFGKGDNARMSASLSAYVASLPKGSRDRNTQELGNNYLMLIGNGDINKGLERFRYALNTEAANAETNRMSEERLGRTSFTIQRDMEVFGMKLKAGQKLNASEAGILVASAQALASGQMAVAAQGYVNGDFLQKTYLAVQGDIADVAKDILARTKGDQNAANKEWESWLKTEAGSGMMLIFRNLTRGMWTFLDKDGAFLGNLGMTEGEFYKSWFLGPNIYRQPQYIDPQTPPGVQQAPGITIPAADAAGMSDTQKNLYRKYGYKFEGEGK